MEEQIITSKKEVAATTVHGFKLPTRRGIEGGEHQEVSWHKPERIEDLPAFKNRAQTQVQPSSDSYRQRLADANTFLDDAQWEAVQTTEGPLLVLAGAGSGKTRVLTSRAAFMLAEKAIPASKMVLVTFTAKAARELKERMRHYPGLDSQDVSRLVISTFHSLFYKMLMHHEPDRWHSTRLLKADWQRLQLVKEAGREIDLEEKEFAFDQALTQISWWKNHLLSPKKVKPKDIFEERSSYLYKRYEEMRLANGSFDFDDMLTGCYDMLKSNEELLKRYQERFAYMAIDEFQDINKIQFQLVQLLAHPQQNMCVVGDDDQSIYGFRGSDPSYIRSFRASYPKAKTVVLNENYRSSHEVVASANRVVRTNKKRLSKELRAQHSSKLSPTLFYPYDEEEEATMIVSDLKERLERGETPADFAILYRTNVAARAVVERLTDSSIPFTVDSDFASFYERKMIRAALSFLRIAFNEEKSEVMSDLLSALFIKRDRVRDVQMIQLQAGSTLLEALPKLEGLPAFQKKKLQGLPAECRKLRHAHPEAALTTIEQKLGLKDYVKKQGQEGNKMEKGSDDLRHLKVIARQFDSVEAFIAHVDHMIAKHQEKREEPVNENGVQLMTIHRAKGLEYKHVYIIGGVEGSLPHDYALDAWREGDDGPLEEERRLMYVAMTRAREELAISVPFFYRGKKTQPSRFVREMKRKERTQMAST
ncbi:ATP-dependent helicase [Shouchella shacheensis]|uniref:ATP-dependent helicase n=1 Tax=Shouchella shacheensis TaxID=1649580 RepID=UPI000B030D75